MAAPSKSCLTLVCENEITRQGIAFLCGQWLIVTRGDELPYCHACKLPQRTWRLATEQEIAARDAAFLRAIERLGFLGPDSHLDAPERS